MKFPLMFGIELEFVGDSYPIDGQVVGRLLAKMKAAAPRCPIRIDNGHRVGWNLGFDGSAFHGIDGCYPEKHPQGFSKEQFVQRIREMCRPTGLELRTPIITETRRRVEMSYLKKFLSVLKDNGCITNSCGMHVHLSCKKDDVRISGLSMSRSIATSHGHEVWSTRRRYCKSGFGVVDRYRAVRVVGGLNHVEFRLFNGTLDYDEVRDRLEVASKAYLQGLRYEGRNGLGRLVSSRKRVAIA